MARYRKRIMLILAVLTIAALAACAPQTPAPVATPAPAPTATPLPVVPAPTANAQETEQRISGVVTDVTANTVTVQTDDGKVLAFETITATTPPEPVEVGKRVDVFYTGTIAGNNTDGVTVTKVEITS